MHAIAVRSPMATIAAVERYQVVLDSDRLMVRVALRQGAPADTLAEIGSRVDAALRAAGADPPAIEVNETDQFETTGIGKHRLVIDRGQHARPASVG